MRNKKCILREKAMYGGMYNQTLKRDKVRQSTCTMFIFLNFSQLYNYDCNLKQKVHWTTMQDDLSSMTYEYE